MPTNKGSHTNDLGQVNNVNVNDSDNTNWTVMANFIYDESIADRWLINLGAGAGIDKVRLDREVPGTDADAVLSEAAAAAKSTDSASVRIVGHTDTVGSNAANQKLSECRASAAKANLVGKGVADSAVSTSGKGESELTVQTGDNVKEPQNRRATVDLN